MLEHNLLLQFNADQCIWKSCTSPLSRPVYLDNNTSQLPDAKMKKFTEDAIKFKMDDTAELYDFDDEKICRPFAELIRL
ncbi:uncharacterized protein LOC131255764 [Magnolia sinica]|uniref:uncharacterized protein LOC131255764 n=1 Tax=Magnolia sinica TaxID=86752 RepID=UPI00265A6777|nr:uncharacterized protein LOC131255764 [Magnolia sinica]